MNRIWSSEVHVGIVLESPVDLLQTWRSLGAPRNGKTHSHGLVVLNIGILAYNDYLEIGKTGLVERVKDELLRWEASRLLVITLDESEQIGE